MEYTALCTPVACQPLCHPLCHAMCDNTAFAVLAGNHRASEVTANRTHVHTPQHEHTHNTWQQVPTCHTHRPTDTHVHAHTECHETRQATNVPPHCNDVCIKFTHCRPHTYRLSHPWLDSTSNLRDKPSTSPAIQREGPGALDPLVQAILINRLVAELVLYESALGRFTEFLKAYDGSTGSTLASRVEGRRDPTFNIHHENYYR